MAFDGITVANIAHELKTELKDGRIAKIAQPEIDELLITIKTPRGAKRLCISASASLPLIYLTNDNKPSPMTAPNFCMLLRKHIGNGRIVNITQPGLERILQFDIEHLDELGDLCKKTLIVELMGKHSNIIFCNEENMIIDSIKHVSSQVSSIREVLPGRSYFVPDTMHKKDPLFISSEEFLLELRDKDMTIQKALYTSFTGISPVISKELCYLSNLESNAMTSLLSDEQITFLYQSFRHMMAQIKSGNFIPAIYYEGKEPKEFSSIKLTHLQMLECKEFSSISNLLETYFAAKNALTRIRQKSADLRHVVQTALDRNKKKCDLQAKQLRDTEKRDKYRVYGELINTYGYNVEEGAKSFQALNYYTNEEITIPLDPQKTTQENAQKYFDRYNKLKRTFEALTTLLQETEEEIAYLESISTALDIAVSEDDLTEIKEELIHSGYVRRRFTKKKVKSKSKPFHYRSSDGYDIYIGKNNLQNDELTFHFAVGNDWWFHAKQRPGSHVIVKTNGDELPDATFEEAAKLAAYYSKGRGSQKIEIDYVEKKHVKKPNGSKPGFVVYYTNYSMMIDSDISNIELISD